MGYDERMNGATIGITAARRADEQASLVRALGGTPLIGSSIDCDRPAADADVAAQIAAAMSAAPTLVVAMTGIGVRHTLAVAQRAGLIDRLRSTLAQATVVARGAKARTMLRRLDIRVDTVADPPSSEGLTTLLHTLNVAGSAACVVCSGPAPDPIVAALRAAGADVATIHPYAIDLPPDAQPALALAHAAAEGTIDAITFTSANAVNGLVAASERAGLDLADPAPSVLVTAVGPVTREALNAIGWRVDVEPATPRMGAMYQALAARLHRSTGGGHSTTPATNSTD